MATPSAHRLAALLPSAGGSRLQPACLRPLKAFRRERWPAVRRASVGCQCSRAGNGPEPALCATSPVEPSFVVVVRVHGGSSDAMLVRHAEWALALASVVSPGALPGAQLWVLADETFCEYPGELVERVHKHARAVGVKPGLLGCFAYTESDMAAAFPVLKDLQDSLPDTQAVRDSFMLPCRKSLAWGCHVESLLLWWMSSLGRGGGGALATRTAVWLLEDDVGFSGDVALFLHEYEASLHGRVDLVAHALKPAEAGWVWRDAASSEFLRIAPVGQRLRCAEHVQRWSHELLQALHAFALRGVTAWSEMSVPTLCRVAGLRYRPLPAQAIGSVFVFDGRVPRTLWPSLCSRPEARNRWWHALKW